MNKNQPIRFAIDNNLLIWLALANTDKNLFNYHLRTTERTYQQLCMLQKLINAGKVEIVLVHSVNRELHYRPTLTNAEQKSMSAQKLANYERNLALKDVALAYVRKTKGVKIVSVSKENLTPYLQKATQIAQFYSEDPAFPEDLYISNEVREEPFLTQNGRPCQSARVMAEATMLGLDLVSLDRQLVGLEPFDIPAKIQEINQVNFLSSARPFRFRDLMVAMMRDDTKAHYMDKGFALPLHKSFAPEFKLVTHDEFMAERKKMAEQAAKAVNLDMDTVLALRALCCRYLEGPIDVASLRKETVGDACALFESLSKKPEPKAEMPVKEKKPAQPAPVKRKPTARVKIDLSSPTALQEVEDFMNKNGHPEFGFEPRG